MRVAPSLALLLALAATAGTALAQSPNPPPPPPPPPSANGVPQNHMNGPGMNGPSMNGPGMTNGPQGMDEDIGKGLTADQRQRVRAILDDAHRQGEALHEATRQKLAAVLSPEQLASWEARHPHPGRGMRGEGRQGPPQG